MKPTLYVETSIISYLRQRPSGQVVAAARQLLTHRWWNEERENYELVTSQYVIDEASKGDRTLVRERLALLDAIPVLPFDDGIPTSADEIMRKSIFPPKASIDALQTRSW